VFIRAIVAHPVGDELTGVVACHGECPAYVRNGWEFFIQDVSSAGMVIAHLQQHFRRSPIELLKARYTV
jgi:arginine/ornithine N-succinyltransferase beta subunit